MFRRNAVNERRDREDRSERRPAEGVRIIRADEAQAALDAGEAAGRRPDDELRYGDVPPAPSGPRPQHRFPLPDSVDPAEAVPRPPLAVPVHSEERNRGRRLSPDRDWSVEPPAAAQTPPVESAPREQPDDGWEVGERTTELDLTAGASSEVPTSIEPGEAPWMRERPSVADPTRVPPSGWAAERHESPWEAEPQGPTWSGEESDRPWAAADRGGQTDSSWATEATSASGSLRAEPPWERARAMPTEREPLPPETGASVSAGGTELPHWSEPPTGEVPKILINDLEEEGDDLAAWRALGSSGTRWRDSGEDWEGLDELENLADLEPAGALDQTRTEHSDLYSFDEDFERAEAERTGSAPLADLGADGGFETVSVRTAAASAVPAARARHSRGASRRVRPEPPDRADRPGGSGGEDLPSRVVVGLGLIILLIICYAIGSKALVVLATVVITAAAAEAYGMLQRSGFRPATLLGLVGTVGVCLGAYWKGIEALPLATVLVFGGAMMWYLLRIVDARPLANVAVTTMTFTWVAVLGSFSALMLRAQHGRGLFLGAVVVAVAADIVAFLVGRWIGNRPMAPGVSPGKTVEGFIGGLVAAVIVGAIIGKELTPWGGMKHGLVLGVIVGLVAPAGDLFESMIKRDLGVKDSGTLLPGHGGLLDRFDSLLVVLPAAYYVASLFSIIK